MQQTDRHENLDDRFLVLGTEKAGQVDDFLEAIRSCINEADIE